MDAATMMLIGLTKPRSEGAGDPWAAGEPSSPEFWGEVQANQGMAESADITAARDAQGTRPAKLPEDSRAARRQIWPLWPRQRPRRHGRASKRRLRSRRGLRHAPGQPAPSRSPTWRVPSRRHHERQRQYRELRMRPLPASSNASMTLSPARATNAAPAPRPQPATDAEREAIGQRRQPGPSRCHDLGLSCERASQTTASHPSRRGELASDRRRVRALSQLCSGRHWDRTLARPPRLTHRG